MSRRNVLCQYAVGYEAEDLAAHLAAGLFFGQVKLFGVERHVCLDHGAGDAVLLAVLYDPLGIFVGFFAAYPVVYVDGGHLKTQLIAQLF